MWDEYEFLVRWADETEDLFDGSSVPHHFFNPNAKLLGHGSITPTRKEARILMYDHTLTLTYRSISAQPPRTAVLDAWASDLGFSRVEDLHPVHTYKVAYDLHAKITNDRLREYHARSRDFGLATTEARHAFRDAVLGYKRRPASILTNGELDKIFAAMGEG